MFQRILNGVLNDQRPIKYATTIRRVKCIPNFGWNGECELSYPKRVEGPQLTVGRRTVMAGKETRSMSCESHGCEQVPAGTGGRRAARHSQRQGLHDLLTQTALRGTTHLQQKGSKCVLKHETRTQKTIPNSNNILLSTKRVCLYQPSMTRNDC